MIEMIRLHVYRVLRMQKQLHDDYDGDDDDNGETKDFDDALAACNIGRDKKPMS